MPVAGPCRCSAPADRLMKPYVSRRRYPTVSRTVSPRMPMTGLLIPVRDSIAMLYASVAWVNMPLVNRRYQFTNPMDIPCDVTINIDVRAPYGTYMSANRTSSINSGAVLKNHEMPAYQFVLGPDDAVLENIATASAMHVRIISIPSSDVSTSSRTPTTAIPIMRPLASSRPRSASSTCPPALRTVSPKAVPSASTPSTAPWCVPSAPRPSRATPASELKTPLSIGTSTTRPVSPSPAACTSSTSTFPASASVSSSGSVPCVLSTSTPSVSNTV